MIKEWNFPFDIKGVNTLPQIEVVQGDLNVCKFNYSLMDGNNPVDLTNQFVRLVLAKSDNKIVWKDFKITDILNGEISITLSASAVACLGNVDAQIKIYGLNSEILTSTKFNFNIVGDLLDEFAVISSPEFQSLTTIINDIDQAIEDVQLIAPIHVEIQADIATGNALHTDLVSDNHTLTELIADTQEVQDNTLSAENSRVIVEGNRVNEEHSRVNTENTRIGAENIRSSSENTRINSENIRLNSEGDTSKGRIKAEDARALSENRRVSSETSRVSTELERRANELARQITITQLKNWYNTSTLTGNLPLFIDGGDYGDTNTGTIYNGGDY